MSARASLTDADGDGGCHDKEQKQRNLNWCDFVGIVFAIVVPNLLVLRVFSAMNGDLAIYSLVSTRKMHLLGYGIVALVLFFCLTCYVLDWHHWHRCAKAASVLIVWSFCCIASVLVMHVCPWAPLLMLLLSFAFIIYCLRSSLSKNANRCQFYCYVSLVALLCGILMAWSWTDWWLDGNRWDENTRTNLANMAVKVFENIRLRAYSSLRNYEGLNFAVDCGPHKDLTAYPGDVRDAITVACGKGYSILYLAWVCPLAAAFADFSISVLFLVNGTVMDFTRLSMVERFFKYAVISLSFVFTGMWACAWGLSAVSMELATTLMVFFVTSLAMVIIWACQFIRKDEFKKAVLNSGFGMLVDWVAESDWTRAFLVGGLNVLIPMFFMVDWARQRVRQCRRITDTTDSLTPLGRSAFNELQRWHCASILSNVCVLGEVYFTFEVGVAKVTYVFLSYVNSQLASVEYSLVVLAVFIVGYTMFLLPPVPGVPVYVLAGIVLGSRGQQTKSIGFAVGCCIAVVVSFALKLSASSAQYALGYVAGKSTKVQQLIGIDKVPTRAIERILQRPGLDVGKVAVLVGGPDWPTSVTCGILKLQLGEMIWGTLPVIFTITPCVMAGAFMGLNNDSHNYDNNAFAEIFMTLSVVLQAGTLFAAMRAILHEITVCGESLSAPRPEHAAVQALTEQDRVYNETYLRVTEWAALGIFRKAVITTAAALMLISSFTFRVMGEWIFENFKVNDRICDPIDDHGLGCNVLNIVKAPQGWVPIVMFHVAVVLHIGFSMGSAMLTKAVLRRDGDASRPHLNSRGMSIIEMSRVPDEDLIAEDGMSSD
mmetsp:Transcript_36002/g.99238  ORF Transcript_36002/g.99238 Transcript_36002/m.99238 type:complete len:825 (+) Transcript_36002:69-2543(+)